MKSTGRERGRAVLQGLGMALVLLLLGASFVCARQQVSYAVYPSRTVIRVGDGENGSFLRAKEVAAALPIDLADTISRGVDPQRIEEELPEASPYIRSATVYISPSTMRLHVIVRERTPVMRYFRNGSSMYLDSDGLSVPQRRGSAAYVPIADGLLTDGTIRYLLYPLAQYLRDHEEWSHFFSYIELLPEGTIHLYPRVGTVVFELRGIDTLEEDLAKVKVYYRKIEPRVGTNKYRLVKLSYDNQIVCVKKTP